MAVAAFVVAGSYSQAGFKKFLEGGCVGRAVTSSCFKGVAKSVFAQSLVMRQIVLDAFRLVHAGAGVTVVLWRVVSSPGHWLGSRASAPEGCGLQRAL